MGQSSHLREILPALLAARHLGIRKIICPYHPSLSNIEFSDLKIIFSSTFEESIQYLLGEEFPNEKCLSVQPSNEDLDFQLDFAQYYWAKVGEKNVGNCCHRWT